MDSQGYFNRVARDWDGLRTSFFSEAVREKAYAVAGLEPGKIAADIGAGTGFIAEGLLRQGLRVIAIDQSDAMLAEMRKKFAGYPGFKARQGEAERLPLPNGSADYAFANMYLHHVESPLQAIREMVRILKPGGKLVITDLDQHSFEFLRQEHHDRWLGFQREEVRRWLEEAGLRQVKVDRVGENCCAQSSCCASLSASISISVAWGEKA